MTHANAYREAAATDHGPCPCCLVNFLVRAMCIRFAEQFANKTKQNKKHYIVVILNAQSGTPHTTKLGAGEQQSRLSRMAAESDSYSKMLQNASNIRQDVCKNAIGKGRFV